MRRDVAAEAARIMATGGQRNYHAAKTKAADRIGVSSRLALPSNREIEQALRDYQAVYGGERHSRHLLSLRQTAIRVMKALERFCPRLVGPVLEGTADEHSRVSIHTFSDPPDEVARHLFEKGLPYRIEERRIRWHDGSFRTLVLLVTDADDAVIELALFESVDLRQSPPSPVDGRPQRRATITEIETLVAAP